MKPHSNPETAPANPHRRWFAGLAALGGLSLAGAAAQAQSWGRRGELDPEERARRLDYRISHLMRDIGGTTQQKDRIVAILSAAQAELRPLREQKRQARLRQLELLAAPVVDRTALEQVRLAQMQAADTRSRRMQQALADAAEVLTPQQRTEVAVRFRQRMERRRGV